MATNDFEDEETTNLMDLITEIWGSEDEALGHLNSLVEEYNQELFDGKLPPVVVCIAPRWVLRGPLGTNTNGGARYEPSDTGTATIYLGVTTITSKKRASEVLAHEMVHHWENTIATDLDSYKYPARIDKMIERAFKNEQKRAHWRAAHSPRFIAKAYSLAKKIGLPVERLLWGQAGKKI